MSRGDDVLAVLEVLPKVGKRKDPPPADETPQNRANVKYVALPLDLWEEVKTFADADERSVSWAAKRLIRSALDALRKKNGH